MKPRRPLDWPVLREGSFPGAEYTPEEVEFIMAVDVWKKKYHRRFPTVVDLMHILQLLGYKRLEP